MILSDVLPSLRGLTIVVVLATSLVWRAGSAPWRANDVVAFIGAGQLVSAAQAGYLEAALTARAGAIIPRFRDFSWEGDTVFARPRPLNFPSLTNLLARAGVTVAVLQFGQMESLAGPERLEDFDEAYERLIQAVHSVVPRVILLTPTAFDPVAPLDSATAQARNQTLQAYVAVIRQLGVRHNVPVINLFLEPSPTAGGSAEAAAFTIDGVQLNERGQRRLAQLVALNWPQRTSAGLPEIESPPWPELDPLRQAIVAKNELWTRYWRPTNWAFLAGDRTEQPSSRDHRDRSVRWFPKEMEEYVPLLEAADAKIAALAQEGTR